MQNGRILIDNEELITCESPYINKKNCAIKIFVIRMENFDALVYIDKYDRNRQLQ